MNTAKITPLYSSDYQTIQQWFHDTRPPYGFQDIYQFNRLYRQAYPGLSREERRRVEDLIDKMIGDVETPKLAKNIFGVV